MDYDDFVIQILPQTLADAAAGCLVVIVSSADQGKSGFIVPLELRWAASGEAGAQNIAERWSAAGLRSRCGDRAPGSSRHCSSARPGDLFIASLRTSPERGLRIQLRRDPAMGEVLASPGSASASTSESHHERGTSYDVA